MSTKFNDGAKPYDQALQILKSALKFGIKPSLKGIECLCARLGQPQKCYPCIQIAGTNGKSSTTRFVAAFMQSLGKHVGLYTSPELIEYRERIEIGGQVVSYDDFGCAVIKANEAAKAAIDVGEIEVVTEFELLTAAAFWLFAKAKVDVAVLEVGLGGRWDATSIAPSKIAVITGVDLDHTAILGDSLKEIAQEKAAIIKPGSAVVLGVGTYATREIFLQRAREVIASFVLEIAAEHLVSNSIEMVNKLDLSKFPKYQKQNITCAVATTILFCGLFDIACAQSALDKLVIPGRFELIRTKPLLLIDAAHNPASARMLAEALLDRYPSAQNGVQISHFDTLLLGVLSDKDALGIVEVLSPLFKNIAVCASASPRAIKASELAQIVHSCGVQNVEIYKDVPSALDLLTKKDAAVVASGSITLAGAVKAWLLANWAK